MKNIFTSIIFLMLCICLYAQYKPKVDIQYLYKLEIINKDLFPVLDDIIRMKSGVIYFKDGPLFTIWLGLDSLKPDLITICAEGKKIFGANQDLGMFNYKENTFLVRGHHLNTTIFSKTNLKRKFIFASSPIETLDNGELVFDLYADERYCTWTCRYHNGGFKLLSFESFDNNVMSFDNTEEEYQQNKNSK